MKAVGADPDQFGAHSLRAGMVTAALASGAAESAVMRRTGHKSREMLDRYYRPATVFASDPLARAL
jgi:integrase